MQVAVYRALVDEGLCARLIPKLDEPVPRCVTLKEDARVRVCRLRDGDARLSRSVLGLDQQLVKCRAQLKVGLLVCDREDSVELRRAPRAGTQ